MLRGRQILWLIYQHYKTSESGGAMYGMRNLWKVQWKGDDPQSLEAFSNDWSRILGGMNKQPQEHELEECWMEQFRETKDPHLLHILAQYDAMPCPIGEGSRTWRWVRHGPPNDAPARDPGTSKAKPGSHREYGSAKGETTYRETATTGPT